MKQFLATFICILIYQTTYGQINYYVGTDLLHTHANVIIQQTEEKKSNSNEFGVYIGNELPVYQKIHIGIDVFYQNNNTVLNELEEDETRFEFHQNIGLKFSPSVRFHKNTFGLHLGVTGMYVFDKKEATGNQIDRYDEAYIYGLFYNRSLHHKWSVNLALLQAIFHSQSHYTNAKMLGYSTFSMGIQYNLFGENE